MAYESIIRMQTSTIKYGFGATREIGYDMKHSGARWVMVAADPNLVNRDPVRITIDALHTAGIDAVLFSNIHIEPTDTSFQEAVQFAKAGNFDYQDKHVKTGLAHQALRPLLGIIDPNNTRSLPRMVVGTVTQKRLTKLFPRPFDESDLSKLFMDSIGY